MKKILRILYIIIAVLCLFENYFIAGLFTGIASLICIVIIGCVNIIVSAIDQYWNELLLYMLCTISIAMSYIQLL